MGTDGTLTIERDVQRGYNSAMEEWLTVTDAAELGEYHPNYIRLLLRQGKVTGRKWGQAWQVSRQSLLSYCQQAQSEGKKRGPKSG